MPSSRSALLRPEHLNHHDRRSLPEAVQEAILGLIPNLSFLDDVAARSLAATVMGLAAAIEVDLIRRRVESERATASMNAQGAA